MTDRNPTHLDYGTFPPSMLMSVTAVQVQLHDFLDAATADTWRKTLEVFASGLRLKIELLPAPEQAIHLHLSSSQGVGVRRKAMLLNWLAQSHDVHTVRVVDPSQRWAPGLTIFIERKTTLLLAR